MSEGARRLLEQQIRQGRGAPTMSAEIPGLYIDRENDALYFSEGVDWDLVFSAGGVWATLVANTFTDLQQINMGATSGADGLLLRGAPLTADGVRSSPGLVLRGGGYTGGTARNVDYVWGVSVTDAGGADDALVLVREYNGGGDVTLISIDDTGNLTALGDANFAGGYRRDLPFGTAALAPSTTARLNYAGVALSYIAKRPGSITGISAEIAAALSGGDVVISAYIDGVIVAGSTITISAGGEVRDRGTFPKDTAGLTFAAGARLDIRYTSGAFAETPAMAVSLEIED